MRSPRLRKNQNKALGVKASMGIPNHCTASMRHLLPCAIRESVPQTFMQHWNPLNLFYAPGIRNTEKANDWLKHLESHQKQQRTLIRPLFLTLGRN